jgi:hypothetical protein
VRLDGVGDSRPEAEEGAHKSKLFVRNGYTFNQLE